MMLTAMAILIGATMVWRGRVTEVPNAAVLRRAKAAINRQVLTLAVTLLAALMPAVRTATGEWLATALALSGIFAMVLFCMRSHWENRLRTAWECSVQESILQTMLPPAAVHVVPVPPVRLRDAA